MPSVAFDAAASPALAAFVGHVDVVVAVHGYGRIDMWTTLLLGGQTRPGRPIGCGAAGSLGGGFTIVDDLRPSHRAAGSASPQPGEPASRGGVQLELPPRVRSGTAAPTYRREYEDAVVDALVEVATT